MDLLYETKKRMNRLLVNLEKIIITLSKTILGILVVMILVPLIYFTWRAGQPMSMPEYSGRSYYELLVGRKNAYESLAREYQVNHPNQRVQFGICFFTEVSVLTFGAIPNAGIYTLAGIYPGLKPFVNHQDFVEGYVPDKANWWNFLPVWWNTFEKFVWGAVNHNQQGPVPYCRIKAP